MFGQCLRRLYSTKPPSSLSLPKKALAARTASTPLAVRLRREKKLGAVAPGRTDATGDGLTPTELARYERLKALGTLPKVKGAVISRRQWLQRVNARRSRIRGFRTVKRQGKSEVEVVGRPIYLPNIIFRLVRNHTPEGQNYNPYEATFRVPPSITKTDIRSYLLAIYGVKTTYIRTDLYYGRTPNTRSNRKIRTTYKRAVVGLVDPFYYPHRMEDMPAKELEKRKAFLEEHFLMQQAQDNRVNGVRRAAAQRMGSNMEKWKDTGLGGRGRILQAVAERRWQKEKLVADQVQTWQKQRENNERIVIQPPKKFKRKPREALPDSESVPAESTITS